MNKVNFRQPKYILPAIIYIPILVTGYFLIDMFSTEVKSVDKNLQQTEYLNPELPEARIDGDLGNSHLALAPFLVVVGGYDSGGIDTCSGIGISGYALAHDKTSAALVDQVPVVACITREHHCLNGIAACKGESDGLVNAYVGGRNSEVGCGHQHLLVAAGSKQGGDKCQTDDI